MKGLAILSMVVMGAFILLGSYQLIQIIDIDWLFIVFFIIGVLALITPIAYQRDLDKEEMQQEMSKEYEKGYQDGSEGKPRR